MTAERKKVILIKNFNPDHNSECLGCDAWASDCECLYLVSDENPEPGESALYRRKEQYFFNKVYVQEVEDFIASIGSGMATPVEYLLRIIAEPGQISLSKDEQKKIFENEGNCEIEMDVFLGEGCGYRIPKLVDNKVIIHL